MATVEPTLLSIVNTNVPTASVLTAGYAYGDGDVVEVPANDKNVVILITCTTAGTLTVSAGTGIAGTNDLDISVEKDKTCAIQLDTSAYETLDDGIFVITSDDAVGTIFPIATL